MTYNIPTFEERTANAIQRMRQYIDPITGAMSYSGADYTAVVFLPMSPDKLQDELNRLKTRKAEVDEDFRETQQLWYDLSTQRVTAVNAHNYTEADRLLRLITRYRLVDRTPRLQLEVESLEGEIEKLESLQGRGSYVRPVVLGDLQTITISSHREKFPVRTLGRVYPKSYTRGGRTLAGSMIFTVLDKHALWELAQSNLKFYSTGVGVGGSDSAWPEMSTVLIDQLPPFDITLIASNEVGDNSYTVLYGVEIVNEGQTMSIQDLATESVMQFYCRDFDPLRPMDSKRVVLEAGREIYHAQTADQVLHDSKKRRGTRFNPFV